MTVTHPHIHCRLPKTDRPIQYPSQHIVYRCFLLTYPYCPTFHGDIIALQLTGNKVALHSQTPHSVYGTEWPLTIPHALCYHCQRLPLQRKAPHAGQ